MSSSIALNLSSFLLLLLFFKAQSLIEPAALCFSCKLPGYLSVPLKLSTYITGVTTNVAELAFCGY